MFNKLMNFFLIVGTVKFFLLSSFLFFPLLIVNNQLIRESEALYRSHIAWGRLLLSPSHHKLYIDMLSVVRNQKQPCISLLCQQLRWARSRARLPPPSMKNKGDEKSEWWIIDGEMHEIGENVPPRERFVIPRDNIPNKRRKQMREQFMRRTRLVLKESEHEPWCKRYMELYRELRENWERLYWDEGYSKKIAQDHANYESAEDDDLDFSPYRRRSHTEQSKGQGFGGNRQSDSLDKVGQIRDKFEYDREKRMREKAFAPMNRGIGYDFHESNSRSQPFDAQKFFPNSSME